VLLVTHNVIEAERSVDRLAILDRGKVVVDGTPAELKASVADELRLELVLEPGATAPDPPAFVTRSMRDGHRSLHSLPATAAGEAVVWASVQQREGRIEEYGLEPATLEDVYVAIVGRADALNEDPDGVADAA
jgi:ABC-2 type transport system ATP-binding protein